MAMALSGTPHYESALITHWHTRLALETHYDMTSPWGHWHQIVLKAVDLRGPRVTSHGTPHCIPVTESIKPQASRFWFTSAAPKLAVSTLQPQLPMQGSIPTTGGTTVMFLPQTRAFSSLALTRISKIYIRLVYRSNTHTHTHTHARARAPRKL